MEVLPKNETELVVVVDSDGTDGATSTATTGGDIANAPDHSQKPLENGENVVDFLDILPVPAPEGSSSTCPPPAGGTAAALDAHQAVDLFGDFSAAPPQSQLNHDVQSPGGADLLDVAPIPTASAVEDATAAETKPTTAPAVSESADSLSPQSDPTEASSDLTPEDVTVSDNGNSVFSPGTNSQGVPTLTDPVNVETTAPITTNERLLETTGDSNGPSSVKCKMVESTESHLSANEGRAQTQEASLTPKEDAPHETTGASRTPATLEDRIRDLEAQISGYEMELSQQQRQNEETTTLLMEIQESMQQQMSAKAEAENKCRLLESKMRHLEEVNNKQSKDLADMADLQSVLQEHMEGKAEAEQKYRSSLDRIAQLEADIQPQSDRIQALERELDHSQLFQAGQAEEVAKIRAERAEQQRKEQSLISRLNAAKKEQAEQSNLAERLEDEIRALEQDLESTRKELSEVSHAKVLLENELEVLKKTSENRLRHVEAALLDERNLNEERKRKMKLFVESKSEELRQAKDDNDSLQSELTQTNKSLVDLNNRWKQLHAQWVQSQTRNRELQRDLNRIKKDSENLHKVGDTLEMKLSRSATETEEHKNKRLAAKHELMTVLRTLEAERELTARLRDSLKFTFTPKALSQQQLLSEGLHEFETQLQKLALRLGRPVPGPSDGGDTSNNSDGGDPCDSAALFPDPTDPANGGGYDDTTAGVHPSRTDAEVHRLIAKLEYETQRVSRGIMALSGNIDRMHVLLDASGDRTCYTVLSELLTTGAIRSSSGVVGSASSSTATSEETRRLGSLRSSHQYGQVPSSLRD